MKKNVIKINENTLRQIVAESVRKVIREDVEMDDFLNRGNKIGPGDPEYDSFIEKYREYKAECERINKEFMDSLTPEEKEYIHQSTSLFGRLGRELELRQKKGLTCPPRPEYKNDGLHRF